MATSLFSPSWYRVQGLKPRLRRHVRIHRHDYRGRVWFVLQDVAAGRSHRISPAAYRMIGLMDGRRSVQRLWEIVTTQLGDRGPTQDEAIRLLGQLHAADAMICDVPPDCRELFRRHQREQGQKLKQKVWSPLAVRIPIWDPDRFLNATWPLAAVFFTRFFAAVWLCLVMAALVFATMNFSAISENIFDRVLTPGNLFVLWLVYPVVKAVHELGHGYAVKKFGGEVHEIGIMFLVFIPVPYVDASAASGFRDKYHRMLVGAVGIMAEMLLAAIALFVWLNAEQGVVHAIAYNVMLIGGISTLLFNGNPLLRFDGYYVLADWLEIPNLGPRSNRHLGYVIQKYAFGSRDAEPVTSLPAERTWFVVYGIAAFIYRMFIMFAIIAYVATRFFFIGVILAGWAIATQVIVPMSKHISFLATSPRLRENRGRAIWTSVAVVGTLIGLLFFVPAPFFSRVEGVTWPSEKAQLRVGTNGFITAIAAGSNTDVDEGRTILSVDDPFLHSRAQLLDTQIAGLEVRRGAVQRSDRVQAALISAEIDAVRSDRDRLGEQIDELMVRSPRAGTVVLPNEPDLEGRFVTRGEVVGYVVNDTDTLTIRVVVDQNDVDLVRQRTKAVQIFPLEWKGEPQEAKIVREVPGGTMQLPTPALGIAGGGSVPVDPSDNSGTRTLERVFEFELMLDHLPSVPLLGRRVMVRFDFGKEPLGLQGWRELRQLFLRLYDV